MVVENGEEVGMIDLEKGEYSILDVSCCDVCLVGNYVYYYMFDEKDNKSLFRRDLSDLKQNAEKVKLD